MKNLLIVILLLFPIFVFAQSDHFDQRSAIRTSPIEFGKAEFHLGYEYYFPNRTSSILIMPSVILKDSPQELKEGFQLETQVRFYLSHLRSDERNVFLGMYNIGLFAGVYAKYINYHEEYEFSWWNEGDQMSLTDRFEKEINAGEAGILIGLQLDVTKRILIDFYVGGGIRYPKTTDTKDGVVPSDYYYEDDSVFDIGYKGVKPKVGFQLGFMF